jgi:hypothetical protein
MGTRWARFARGLFAALASTFVAACSHTFAGGSTPSVVGLALCLAFSSILCVLLAGKTLSLGRLSLAIGLSQFAFHGAFSLLTDARPMPAAPGLVAGFARHAHGDMLQFAAGSPAMPALAVMPPDATMWLGHAVAAVATIAAFRFGEGAFWSLVRLGTMAISRLLPTLPPAWFSPRPKLSAVAVDRGSLPRRLTVFFSALRHRGPPTASASF